MAMGFGVNGQRDRSQDEWIEDDLGYLPSWLDPVEFAKRRHPKALCVKVYDDNLCLTKP